MTIPEIKHFMNVLVNFCGDFLFYQPLSTLSPLSPKNRYPLWLLRFDLFLIQIFWIGHFGEMEKWIFSSVARKLKVRDLSLFLDRADQSGAGVWKIHYAHTRWIFTNISSFKSTSLLGDAMCGRLLMSSNDYICMWPFWEAMGNPNRFGGQILAKQSYQGSK